MIVVRHFIPKQRVVLFNSRVHCQIKGVLYISNPSSKLNTLYSRHYLHRMAFVCLFIAILGFAAFATPIMLLELKYRINYNPPKLVNTAPFRIIIPKLGIDSKIIENVDPSNEVEYSQKLKEGIAHARGSYLPGEGGPIFLFAHSTDSLLNITQYNASFYAVKDLEVGDDIEILYQGKRYIYKVSDKKITAPQDLDYIKESKDSLFLQTCWPPGTQWQRLVVSAKMTS